MKNEKWHLVTSSDKKTWNLESNLIFISNYCLLYSKKKIVSQFKYKILGAYFDNNKEKEIHEKRARNFEEKIFEDLCVYLNKFHSSNYSRRFWRILIGHWLRRYVNIIYGRAQALQKCLGENNVNSFTHFKYDNYSLSTKNTRDLIFAGDDPIWNNVLYAKLIKLNNNKINLNEIENKFLNYETKKMKKSFKRKFIFRLYDVYSLLTNFFIKKNSPVISNTYLPFKFEFLLNLFFKKFPKIYKTKEFDTNKKADLILRNKLQKDFYIQENNFLKDSIYGILFDAIPIEFLEAFDDLVEKTKKMHWPKNPSFIFTSNNFDTDEFFKCYIALSVEKGTNYFVGQHGNTYGSHRFQYLTIEEITSTKFFTWGWSEDPDLHYVGFSFFNLRKRILRNKKAKKLILVGQNLGTNVEFYDLTTEFEQYWNDQYIFVDNIEAHIKDNLLVRLFNITYWDEKNRWNDYDSNIKLNSKTDKPSIPINDILSVSKLCIVTFDSTVIHELLINDIPFVAYWTHPLEQVRKSAKPLYKKLIDAKILFNDPIKAASHVNNIWENVDLWWSSEVVKFAKSDFKSYFIKSSPNPIVDLSKFLNTNNYNPL